MTTSELIEAHELLKNTQKQLREIHDKIMCNAIIDQFAMKQLYRSVEDAVYYCAQSEHMILKQPAER